VAQTGCLAAADMRAIDSVLLQPEGNSAIVDLENSPRLVQMLYICTSNFYFCLFRSKIHVFKYHLRLCLKCSVNASVHASESDSGVTPERLRVSEHGWNPSLSSLNPHLRTHRMAYHGAGAPAYNLVQNVTVCPDTAYTFSFWAHTDGEPYTTTCQLNVCFNGVCQPAASIV
jgi:hypothetical protein